MQVGTRLRITLHGASEDFAITHIHNDDVYAASALDAARVIRLQLRDGELSMPEVPEAVIYAIYALSGNLNLDIRILAKVDDAVLSILAELDAGIKTLIQSNEVWYAKAEVKFGDEVLQFKPQNISAQDFYNKAERAYAEISRSGANTVFLTASETGDLTALRIALHAGANMNETTKYTAQRGIRGPWLISSTHQLDENDQLTALLRASKMGHLEIVKELLARGANVNAAGNIGGTALIKAAGSGHVDIVRELIAHGATVDAVSEYGYTALMAAAVNGNLDVVKELLAHGANVNVSNNAGWTPLLLAARNGKLGVVKELLARGANINAAMHEGRGFQRVDQNGFTALMWASMHNHLQTVQELIRARADVHITNQNGTTALMAAADAGHIHVVRELLRAGANVNARSVSGSTALMQASSHGHVTVVKALLEAGANSTYTDNHGDTALKLAFKHGHQILVHELQARGVKM